METLAFLMQNITAWRAVSQRNFEPVSLIKLRSASPSSVLRLWVRCAHGRALLRRNGKPGDSAQQASQRHEPTTRQQRRQDEVFKKK